MAFFPTKKLVIRTKIAVPAACTKVSDGNDPCDEAHITDLYLQVEVCLTVPIQNQCEGDKINCDVPKSNENVSILSEKVYVYGYGRPGLGGME